MRNGLQFYDYCNLLLSYMLVKYNKKQRSSTVLYTKFAHLSNQRNIGGEKLNIKSNEEKNTSGVTAHLPERSGL